MQASHQREEEERAAGEVVLLGPDVKAHVLATEGQEELRIVLVKKDEREGVAVDVIIKGGWRGGRRGWSA